MLDPDIEFLVYRVEHGRDLGETSDDLTETTRSSDPPSTGPPLTRQPGFKVLKTLHQDDDFVTLLLGKPIRPNEGDIEDFVGLA